LLASAGLPLEIDVLANDTGYSEPVAVEVTGDPAQGVAVVSGSPGAAGGIRITYTADPGASGADSFVYTVTDDSGSDSATVSLIVGISASDDTAETTRNAAVTIAVLANDQG